MKKALITGSEGFVGKYMCEELLNHGYQVIGLDIVSGTNSIRGDLLNKDCVKDIIKKILPDIVIHLAGQANVGIAWQVPQETIELNVIASINLMEAVRIFCPGAKMLMIGSSDQYGPLKDQGKNVTEDTFTKAITPYAVSKKAQEEMAQVYVEAYGMHICMTRSFNSYGAGQKKGFLIPDFASGIAAVEYGLSESLFVGNLEARRDFTHVKDVVHAYRMIAEKGHSGEIYNVGSGKTYSASEILNKLLGCAKCSIKVDQDLERIRPLDTPVVCCDHSKLSLHTGWQPKISMDDEIANILDYYRIHFEK